MTTTFQKQIASLKKQIHNTDVFGDAYDDLNDNYIEFIDSIETFDDKVEKLNYLKQMFINDDLYASYPEQFENYNIFPMINNIIKSL